MKKSRRRKQRTDSYPKLVHHRGTEKNQFLSSSPLPYSFLLLPCQTTVSPVEILSFLFSLCLCDSVVNKPGAVVLLRSRMRLVIHRQHVFHGKLCIALRRRQPFVTQHFLDRAQVCAFLQHVRAEGVP
jgi:hypothetical protein